jgi:hypothetical protein
MTTQSIFDRIAGHRPTIEATIIEDDFAGDEVEPLIIAGV